MRARTCIEIPSARSRVLKGTRSESIGHHSSCWSCMSVGPEGVAGLAVVKQMAGLSDFFYSFALEGMFLFQKRYVIKLLKRAHMLNCNLTRTPVGIESILGLKGIPISDPTLYRSLAGGIQYLTFTCPDLSYVMKQICLYMHAPHLAALKRIICYDTALWSLV
ncbi:ribonuclease H-like domain-containing protein [Tanacetum coccineum]